MAFLRTLRRLLTLALLIGAGAVAFVVMRGPPPGHEDLAAPVSRARLDGLDVAACRALLGRAGIAYRALPEREGAGGECGFGDGVAWEAGGAREVRYAPAAPALACPLAVALSAWEWDVVQPAAVRAFGTTVAEIDHYGSYACRRIYGRKQGDWSEHARAAAIDVAGFRLSDGRRVTVAADWRRAGPEADFLHAVRDGACRMFGTTLSPDYNAAHHDHLHLDAARRGGWGVCR